MKTRHFHFLLALMLLLSQQLAVLHEFSHSTSGTYQSRDQSAPGDPICDLCLALSPLGAALGSVCHFDFAVFLAPMRVEALFHTRDIPAPPHPFQSRAPPSLFA